MKKNLVLLIFCALGLTTMAQNPLVGVDHSVFTDASSLTDVYGFGVPTAYPPGHSTFRVYGYLDDANSVMQAVIGVPSGLEAYIGTDLPDGYLWNYPGNGVNTGVEIPNTFVPFTGDGGTWMYDSYATIGSENDEVSGGVNMGGGSQGGLTFGIGVSNVPAGDYWGNADYSDILNPDFIMTNEAWLLGDVTNVNAYGVGPSFQVLLAQLTTLALDIHYGLNVTALTDVPLSGGETWITYWDASGLGGTTFNEADGTALGLLYPAALLAGCTDTSACNYDSTAASDDGSCTYGDWYIPTCPSGGPMVQACADPGLVDYVLAGDQACAQTTADGDSFCVTNTMDNVCFDAYWACTGDVGGCTDITACNYDSLATADDCSCDFASCQGCMDTTACNYDSTATIDDGSCIFGTSTNDLCADAIAVADGSVEAVDNSCAPVDEAASETAGLWYMFDITAEAEVNIETTDLGSGSFDTNLELFDGCPADGGVSIAFNDDGGAGTLSLLSFACGDLAAGTYWVLVDGFGGATGTTDLTVSIDELTCVVGCTDTTACNYDSGAVTDDGSCTYPLANDLCSGAEDMGTGNVVAYPGDNTGACAQDFATVPFTGGCNTQGEWCEPDVDNDVWFSWTSGAVEAQIEIEVGGGTNTDTQLAVYTDCSGVGSVIGANDDSSPNYCSFCSYVVLECGTVPANTTLYIQVDGYNGSEGDFVIDVTENSTAGCTDPTACNYDSTVACDDGSCIAAGCTDPLACNYDSTAGCDDGSCASDNDSPDCTVVAVPVSDPGSCVSIGVDLTGATDDPTDGSTGADRWYSFVAISSVSSVQLTNVNFGSDARLELYDSGFVEIDVADNTFTGTDDEIMNTNGLIVGDTYYVVVMDWFTEPSTGTGDLCIVQYPDSGCDLPPSLAAGPFTIQSQLKADYNAAAAGYTLTMTSTTTGLSYTSPMQAGTWIYIVYSGAPNVPDNYDATLSAVFNVVNGAGTAETLSAGSSCNVDVGQFDTYLVAAHNCANKTWALSGRPKAAPPQVDAGSFTWEFTQTAPLPGAAWEYTTPTGARKLPAGGLGAIVGDDAVSMIDAGATYNVRIRANYNSGSATDFGPMDCLAVAGASSGDAANGPSDTDGTFAESAKSIQDLYGEELTIYPNPSNGEYFNLSISEVNDNKVLVDIVDLTGRTIQSVQLSADVDAPFNQQISLDNLSSGNYMVNVTVGSSRTSTQLVVVR